MQFPFLPLVLIGVTVVVVGWFLSGWNLHKANKRENTSLSTVNLTSNSFWFSLTDAEQKTLNGLKTFIEQEDWVESHAAPNILLKANPEKIVVDLANKGSIRLGEGAPRRLALISDLVSTKTPEKVSRKVSLRQQQAEVKKRLLDQESVKRKNRHKPSSYSPSIRFKRK